MVEPSGTPVGQPPAPPGTSVPPTEAAQVQLLELQLKNSLEDHDQLVKVMREENDRLRNVAQAQAKQAQQGKAELAENQRTKAVLETKVTTLQAKMERLLNRPPNIKLPTFDPFFGQTGENIKSWQFGLEQTFALAPNCSDLYKITAAGAALRGPAKVWYTAVREDEMRPEYVRTWEEFKESMRAHFNPINPVRLARDQLAELSQKGGVRDYTTAFRHLCSQIPDIGEAEKLDRYVRGLRPQTKLTVNLEDPSSYEHACRIAETYDSAYSSTRPSMSMPQSYGHSSDYASPPYTPQAHNDGPTPMDVNVMRNREDEGGEWQNYGQHRGHNREGGKWMHYTRHSSQGPYGQGHGQDHGQNYNREGERLNYVQHPGQGYNHSSGQNRPTTRHDQGERAKIMADRRLKDLCLYCGADDHKVRECPKTLPHW